MLFLLYIGIGISIGYGYSFVSTRKLWTFYSSCINYVFKPRNSSSLTKLTKSRYQLEYVYNDTMYRIIIPIKRGPKHIVSVYDENMQDITNQIRPYLGPNEDFHSVETTPRQLNHKQLHFLLRNENMVTFNENETIYVKKHL